MVLYHRATAEAARAIVADGFRDQTGFYRTHVEPTGIWFSERPLHCNEGAKGTTLLRVTLRRDKRELWQYEWIE